MNKKQLLLLILILFLVCGCAFTQRQKSKDKQPELVADQLYYWEGENLGISIFCKFNSQEQMAETLSLSKEVGTFNGRKWKLSDILVSADFNANGYVADWKVSGPKPLLLDYLEQLKAGDDEQGGHLFYDFGYSFINFKPTAYWEDGWAEKNE